MAPTRKYMDHKNPPKELSLFASVVAFLLVGLFIGVIIYLNIEVWTAIFD